MKKVECGNCGHQVPYVSKPMLNCPGCSSTFDNYYFKPGEGEARNLLIGAAVIGLALLAGGYFMFFTGDSAPAVAEPLSKLITSGEQTHKSVFGPKRKVQTNYSAGALTVDFPLKEGMPSTSATRSTAEFDCFKIIKQVQGLTGLKSVEVTGTMRMVSNGSKPEKVFSAKYDIEQIDEMDFNFHNKTEIMLLADDIWWHEELEE